MISSYSEKILTYLSIVLSTALSHILYLPFSSCPPLALTHLYALSLSLSHTLSLCLNLTLSLSLTPFPPPSLYLSLSQGSGAITSGTKVSAIITGPLPAPVPTACYHKRAACLDIPVEAVGEREGVK